MQFRIRGSVGVALDDRPLSVGGYKQRAALVVLLLSPNRVVLADRMIHELWGEEAPRQAAGSLQAYISNLRRVLEPDRAPREPARLLRSQPGGYLLAVEPGQIDASRFEQLAGEGRGRLRAGHPGAASEALTQALEEWRGPALAEFRDEPFAAAEAARLEELRAVALEDRIAADLALGEHGAVIAELQGLVAQEPLREQLWAHLILALYRSGRQGDALAAYRSCRRTLDEELGIEPGPTLRQLERDVLAQAPSLEWAPTVPAAPGAAHAIPRASLVFRDGSERLHVFPLDDGDRRITIGREASADIRLSWDGRVSRLHAELTCQDEGWTVADEGMSSNGSYVNDERIHAPRPLADGDELRFGETVMTFRSAQQSGATKTILG